MLSPASHSTPTHGLRYSHQLKVKKKFLSLPDQRGYQYSNELAYKLAVSELAMVDDIGQLCLKSGAQLKLVDSQEVIVLEFLNRSHQIRFSDIDVSSVDGNGPIPLRDKLLILHYLRRATGSSITDKIITFKELPEGASYFPKFSQRAIKPLIDNFSREPHRLLDAALKLGGYEADYGDAAVTINAFSRLTITLVLWQGDDEFAPRGSILFSSTISDYLSTEDITVLCETISWRLVKALKKTDEPGYKAGEK